MTRPVAVHAVGLLHMDEITAMRRGVRLHTLVTDGLDVWCERCRGVNVGTPEGARRAAPGRVAVRAGDP